MPTPLEQSYWDEEADAMYEEMLALFMSALTLGMDEGTDILPSNIQPLVNPNAFNQAAIDYARSYRYSYIQDITDTTRTMTQDALATWLQSGQPLDVLEQQIASIFGEARAAMIAATETTRVVAEGNLVAWTSTGFVEQVRFNTANDDKVCPYCSPQEGEVFERDDYGHLPPIHVNCILPGNEVVCPDLIAASKSFYIGGCIEITICNGRRLTVTENHPILTTRGWIAAKFINESDNVIVATNPQRIFSSINPYDQYRPAVVEKIFSSFMKSSGMFSRRVKVTPEDFHGDGRSIYGNVDIVHTHSFLRSNIKSDIFQPISQLQFNRGGMLHCTLHSQGSFGALKNRRYSSLGRFMRGGNLSHALSVGHGSPLQRLGLGLIAGLNFGSNQSPSESRAIDACLAGEFILRFASDVALQKVIKVKKFDYFGHVYDLQSDIYGLYTCNGVVVKNCRCFLTPVVDLDLVSQQLDEALGL
jgi:SPP1 gp7 family putative phage head morphogenesis protein